MIADATNQNNAPCPDKQDTKDESNGIKIGWSQFLSHLKGPISDRVPLTEHSNYIAEKGPACLAPGTSLETPDYSNPKELTPEERFKPPPNSRKPGEILYDSVRGFWNNLNLGGPMLSRTPECRDSRKKPACCKGKLVPFQWLKPLGRAKDCSWCKGVPLS